MDSAKIKFTADWYQVESLQNVLESDYGFKVYNKQLHIKKRPQQQALKHLSEFVEKEDAEQGLLIIYYAGHGYADVDVKSGDMLLAG